MDRTKRFRLLGSALMVMVLAAGLTSCSKDDEDDLEEVDTQNYNAQVTMKCSFIGVWTMNEVIADTVNVDVRVDSNAETGNKYLAAFSGFPYKAIVNQVAPDVNVAKITDSMIIGGPLPPDEALLLQTIVEHGDIYNCMEVSVLNGYRCVGVSESSLFFELLPGRDYSVLYLPFVVTTDNGEFFSITATLVPSKSTAILDINGKTFSCILNISEIEFVKNGEKQIKKLSPEMKMKYTSFQRID